MNKNICMIAYSNYSTDARIRREAETLASLPGYDVSVLALKEATLPRIYSLDNVRVQELNLTKYRGKSNIRYLTSYFKFLSLAFFACNKLLSKNSIDIIHVHNMPNFLVFSAIVPLAFKKKLILDVHDTMIETYSTKFSSFSSTLLSSILHFEEALSCVLAHKIICVNHIQRDALVNRGIPKDKIVISMNVPDPKRFNGTEGIEDRPGGSINFKIVYFGTITKRLGVDLALQALAKLNGRIRGLEFHVIGEGEDKEEFMRLSNKLGLEEAVHFSENILQFEELITILKGMDLSIVPNRRNSATELMLPVKMLESVALGIPVVAPRLKTIDYYFSDDMVYFFEPDNVDSLAEAVWSAYQSKEIMAERAKNAKAFLQKYGWESHKYELIDLYGSLFDKKL
jgi:glycosyltransferase involved in cell wall biosynthesis